MDRRINIEMKKFEMDDDPESTLLKGKFNELATQINVLADSLSEAEINDLCIEIIALQKKIFS
jgi:predicted HicB family RNase H-like nuclease